MKIIAWIIAPFLMIITIMEDKLDLDKPENIVMLWVWGGFFGIIQFLYWMFPFYLIFR